MLLICLSSPIEGAGLDLPESPDLFDRVRLVLLPLESPNLPIRIEALFWSLAQAPISRSKLLPLFWSPDLLPLEAGARSGPVARSASARPFRSLDPVARVASARLIQSPVPALKSLLPARA